VALRLNTAGPPIGSALIDLKVLQPLAERLSYIQDSLSASPVEMAEKMMLGKFERFKGSFGNPIMAAPKLYLSVPGLLLGMDFPLVGIRNLQSKYRRNQ
jgi:hypothetical protein